MATFEAISEKQAPQQPKKTSGRLGERMIEYDGYIRSVKKAEVGRLIPSPNETSRGIALRLSRAGKRIGIKVETWVVEDQVYFRTT